MRLSLPQKLGLFVFAVSPLIAFAHGISEDDKQRMLDGGYLQYVGLGASHMLTGYDHLLFLLGVVFFLTTFKDVVKFVTVFTIGHCITLIFATFFKITWNYWLVDAIIAISVIYKAFDNNGGFQKHFNMPSPNLVKMVFIFGLLHGFGLSTPLLAAENRTKTARKACCMWFFVALLPRFSMVIHSLPNAQNCHRKSLWIPIG